MTKKTRRLIFYIFLTLFVVIALAIILYAQGYSFDWHTKSLIMTGAFYFKSYPKEANIYIDNELQGKTNKFIKRLMPQEYDIKISKSDYYDWQKTLEIKSKLVTEAKNILLIKKNRDLNLVTKNKVKYLSLSPNKKRLVYVTDTIIKEINPDEQQIADPREVPIYPAFALRLIDLANNIDTQIYPPQLAQGTKSVPIISGLDKITGIDWSNDNEKLIISLANNNYYILNLKNEFEIIAVNNLIKTASNYKIYNIEKLSFYPQDSNKIYLLANNNIYLFNLPGEKSLSLPLVSDVLTYTINASEILYIKYPNGEFYKTNLDASSFKKITDIPFFKSGQNVNIINNQILIVDGKLYLYNPQNQSLKKIVSNVIQAELSDDEKKFLWGTKNEVGIIWLDDDSEQPMRKKYETEILMKTVKEMKQALWYSKTNQHIIFVLANEIKITELDSRDKRNTADIISTEHQKIFYNKENDTLYLLNKNQLFETKIND